MIGLTVVPHVATALGIETGRVTITFLEKTQVT